MSVRRCRPEALGLTTLRAAACFGAKDGVAACACSYRASVLFLPLLDVDALYMAASHTEIASLTLVLVLTCDTAAGMSDNKQPAMPQVHCTRIDVWQGSFAVWKAF